MFFSNSLSFFERGLASEFFSFLKDYAVTKLLKKYAASETSRDCRMYYWIYKRFEYNQGGFSLKYWMGRGGKSEVRNPNLTV